MNFLLSLIVLEIAKISVSVPSIPEACPWPIDVVNMSLIVSLSHDLQMLKYQL